MFIMPDRPLAGLSNQRLLEFNRARRELFARDITKFYPWWRRCDVNLLIVTDGNLNFGEGDFGLSTFIRTMLDDAPWRVNFRLTLGHLRASADMLSAETRHGPRVVTLERRWGIHLHDDPPPPPRR